MKFISGDFVAEYNKLIEEYQEKQRELDSFYDEKISKILNLERERLEDSLDAEYTAGDQVIIHGVNVGVVEDSQIDFSVMSTDEDFTYGPERYYPLKDGEDEKVITCYYDLIKYRVRTDSSELEKDYGLNHRSSFFFSEDLKAKT